MNKFLTKMRDIIGLDQVDDEMYVLDGEGYTSGDTSEDYPSAGYGRLDDEQQTNRRISTRSHAINELESGAMGMSTGSSNVIGMPRPANGVPEVVIIEPHSFEEMPQAIQALRERKSVILNLGMMDLEQAQRAVDFVAGGTYAIDGHQERIGESIFLFTPNCVQVSTQSGVAHEAPQAQIRTSRAQTPAPAWGTEVSSMTA
jgi:cell division inhibitor SepF